MKLRDLLDHDRLLLVACEDCHAKTPLDPASFALRHGAQTDVATLIDDLLCPSCGSTEITLRAFSPVEQRELAVTPAREARA
jgi:Zn finger protein HypA/HybF involved in hydrogenase expression